MTQKERSILIATATAVVALVALLGAVLVFGPEGDPLVQADGQFISNGDNASAANTESAVEDGRSADDLATAGVDDGALTGGDSGGPADATDDGSAQPQPAQAAPTASTGATATTTTTAPTTSTTAPSSTSTTAPTTTEAPATTAATTTAPLAPGELHAIEHEVLSLTNQLRADPSGPLARQKPMPECTGNAFYGITIDEATGHPTAVGALALDEAVSVELARDWSVQMDQGSGLVHRSNAAASAIYTRLGINWAATGENIAWFSGYPDSEAARIFFEGWRESDTGHYCALVAGAYTHVGVGYHKGAEKSWATQNFYRLR